METPFIIDCLLSDPRGENRRWVECRRCASAQEALSAASNLASAYRYRLRNGAGMWWLEYAEDEFDADFVMPLWSKTPPSELPEEFSRLAVDEDAPDATDLLWFRVLDHVKKKTP